MAREGGGREAEEGKEDRRCRGGARRFGEEEGA